jgi:hypothetical protein
MSWHFSQALGAAYSEANSSDGAPFAPSSGTPTHGTCWSPGKTTVALKPSRSGMTFRPLTDDLGEAVLTWYLAASPVRTSPPPEKEPESKASAAACGSTWRESSVKYCLASSGWKTHRCLWEEDLEWSSLTLPKWGMMRVGVLWERTTPEHLTSETESGLWATPTASTGGPEPEGKTGRKLVTQVAMWPTPCTRDYKGVSGAGRQEKKGNPQDTLCNAVAARMWPTPTTNDSVGAGYQRANGNHYFTLPGAVGATKHLPPEMEEKRMRTWPTPGANEDSYRLNGNSQQSNSLGAMARREALAESSDSGGQLNPTWVEWLMGWPLGWTDCAASAMAKFQPWCHSHGISCPPNPLRTEN